MNFLYIQFKYVALFLDNTKTYAPMEVHIKPTSLQKFNTGLFSYVFMRILILYLSRQYVHTCSLQSILECVLDVIM